MLPAPTLLLFQSPVSQQVPHCESHVPLLLLYLFIYLVLEMKPKAPKMLGKHSPTELHPQTLSGHFHQIICLFLLFSFLKIPLNSPLSSCPSHCSTAVKRSLYERKHLTEGLLTLSEIQFIIITIGSMVAFRQALGQ